MKIIFMGNPEFACPSLRALNDSKYNIVGVISNPAKRMKRSKDVSLTSIGSLAKSLNLNLFTPNDFSSSITIDWIKSLKPDMLVVVAFKILPASIISIPKLGAVNLHASLLPKYRGAAPIQHAIMNGDSYTGNTTFLIEPKVDRGNVILQRRVDIERDDNFITLSKRMSESGADLLIKSLDTLKDPMFEPKVQDDSEVTYAPKIHKSFGRIEWRDQSQFIHLKIKAISSSPGTFTTLNRKRLKIFDSKLTSEISQNEPGTIICMNEKILVSCSDFYLELIEVQLEGKKKMSALDWFRGRNEEFGFKFD